jgi:hypothetical protein
MGGGQTDVVAASASAAKSKMQGEGHDERCSCCAQGARSCTNRARHPEDAQACTERGSARALLTSKGAQVGRARRRGTLENGLAQLGRRLTSPRLLLSVALLLAMQLHLGSARGVVSAAQTPRGLDEKQRRKVIIIHISVFTTWACCNTPHAHLLICSAFRRRRRCRRTAWKRTRTPRSTR